MLFSKFRSFVRKFTARRDGVAAVEFAIGAPVMLGFLVIMTDFGLAVHERMTLDQAVRAGAEFAMNEVEDPADLKKLIQGAATGYYSDNQDDWDAQSITPPDVSATAKFCECPDAPGTSVACGTTICSNNLPASVYYKLSAKRTYQGIVIDIPLQAEMRVQVR